MTGGAVTGGAVTGGSVTGDQAAGRGAGRNGGRAWPQAPRGQARSWLRVTWLLHRNALLVTLVLLLIAVGCVIDAAIRLPGIAAQAGPLWARIAPVSYSPKYPDVALRVLWMLVSVSLGVQVTSRETEHGTAAFAWAQGAGRARWLLGSALPGTCLLATAAAAFGQAFAWYYRVYPADLPRRDAFGLFSPALAGWALAGVAIGLAAGALIRQPAYALYAGVAGYAALDKLVSSALRPEYPGWPALSGGGFWTAQLTELALLAVTAAAFTALAWWRISGAELPRLSRAELPRLRRPRVIPGPAASSAFSSSAFSSSAFSSSAISSSAISSSAISSKPAGSSALDGLITARGGEQAAGTGRVGWPGPRRRAGVALTMVTWRLHGWRLAWSVVVLIAPVIWLVAGWQESPGRLSPQPVLGTLMPVLAGGLTGAQLLGGQVRGGTARFAWTQGVTRRRWAAGQLIRAGAVLAAAATVAGLVTWWQASVAVQSWQWPPISVAGGPTGLYPPVLIAGTLACFAFATLVGELMDSTVVSVYLTIVFGVWAWVLASGWLHHHLPTALTGSLWAWQFTQSGILVLLAAALGGAAVWLVRYLTA